MKRSLAGLLLLAALVASLAVAEPSKTPAHAKSHGNSLAGVVVRVDAASKTFVVRAPSGMETTLVRTGATRVQGETLKPGDRVAVRWLEKDGKKIATSVRVDSAALAAATPTASAGTR
jgi:hypothetical protein